MNRQLTFSDLPDPAPVATNPRPTPPKGPILFVAFRDGGRDMIPASKAGQLATFPDIEAARRAAGALGVAAPETWAQALDVAARHGLRPPDPPKNGGPA